MIAKKALIAAFNTLVKRFAERRDIQSIGLDTNERSVLYDFDTEETEEMNPLPVFIDFAIFTFTFRDIYRHSVGMRMMILKIPHAYANFEGGEGGDETRAQVRYYDVSPYASGEVRRGGYSLCVRQIIGECIAWVTETLKAPERVVERSRAIHEELVAATWAPKRVAAWLEAGAQLEDL
jgi:hypothetical protein